jgi:putative salt-induced outer membrane protein YdiY
MKIFSRSNLITLTLLLLAHSAQAARTDVIVLANGNAVTGEIESLDFGALEYGTDSMGTVLVDWEDIVGITSNQKLQVEVSNGQRYFGNLEAADERFHIKVVTLSGPVELATERIVRITPIDTDETFWHRLEGNFNLGFNSQKSSDVSTANLAADIRYRAQTYLVGLKASANFVDQPDAETQRRMNLGLNYQRFRGNRWFTDWFTGWDRDDELGISARYSAGGALGRYLVQTNKNQFSLSAGLQATRELIIGEDDDQTKAEGRIQVRYLHRNIDPEASMSFTSNIFPLIEDLSEYRAETDLSFKRDLIEDLYLEVLFWHSYVSDPPTDAVSTDYGITTSIGFSF